MFGLEVPELILNEWNYIRGWLTDEWKYSLRMEKSLKGASVIAGALFSPLFSLFPSFEPQATTDNVITAASTNANNFFIVLFSFLLLF